MKEKIKSNVAYELFGEMRYLTPEENKKKAEMYRKMSEVVGIERENNNEFDNQRNKF